MADGARHERESALSPRECESGEMGEHVDEMGLKLDELLLKLDILA